MAKGNGTTKSVGASAASAGRAITVEKTAKVSLSQISVSDSSYRFSLGKAPKGKGNWAFSIGSKEAFIDITKAFWHYGKYSDAVKAAKKEAQKRGKTIIYTMS